MSCSRAPYRLVRVHITEAVNDVAKGNRTCHAPLSICRQTETSVGANNISSGTLRKWKMSIAGKYGFCTLQCVSEHEDVLRQ